MPTIILFLVWLWRSSFSANNERVHANKNSKYASMNIYSIDEVIANFFILCKILFLDFEFAIFTKT